MVDVFLHTNRAFTAPPSGSSYRAHAGWAAETVAGPGRTIINISRQRAELNCCWRAPWNTHGCYKYDWMLHEWRKKKHSGQASPMRRSPVLLADTDVLFQCTAAELRRRFESRFGGAPMVVGGERHWFPRPDKAHDPFGPDPRLPFKVKYAGVPGSGR